MQTLILNHYPIVIQGIKEIGEMAKAEDIEFSKLRKQAKEAANNMFLVTAGELGVRQFEYLLGIKPKASQSIEERKFIIQSMANRRKMSIRELADMLSGYSDGIEISNNMEQMEMHIILNTDVGKIKTLYQIVDEILPLNICVLFEHVNRCKLPIYVTNTIRFTMAFYPRYNLPRLHLNGTWMLDGSRHLSGYNGYGAIDLYPVRIRMRSGVKAAPNESIQVNFKHEAREEVGNASSVLIRAPTIGRPKTRESITIPMAFRQETAAGGITIHNENDLDGTWKLDGSRKLNGGSESR